MSASSRPQFAIGDTVRVTEPRRWVGVDASKPWTGTIRAKSTRREGLFRVDDGKPEAPNMDTNGWSVSVWADEAELEVLTGPEKTP
jgi:hypothetical protein